MSLISVIVKLFNFNIEFLFGFTVISAQCKIWHYVLAFSLAPVPVWWAEVCVTEDDGG